MAKNDDSIDRSMDLVNFPIESAVKWRPTDLEETRASHPFVQVLPWPASMPSAVIATAGTVKEINIPSNTKMIKLVCTAPCFFSFQGNAGAAKLDGQMLVLQETDWFYIGPNTQISVTSEFDNVYASVQCVAG